MGGELLSGRFDESRNRADPRRGGKSIGGTQSHVFDFESKESAGN
jgi:hypothetical protein